MGGERRRSDALIFASVSCRLPVTAGVLPDMVMSAPILISSEACMKRFSNIVAVTLEVPSACVIRAMYCACMSVGKPG